MNEAAWVIGIVVCALGVAMCTKANFGLSMIAAPPYILHVWLRDALPWFSQGTSEYVWQTLLLIMMCVIIRGFKARYLLSFGTAMLSGFVLDGWLWLFGGNGAYEELWLRIVMFVLGELVTTLAVAFIFRTTLPVQICELAVCEKAGIRYSDACCISGVVIRAYRRTWRIWYRYNTNHHSKCSAYYVLWENSR